MPAVNYFDSRTGYWRLSWRRVMARYQWEVRGGQAATVYAHGSASSVQACKDAGQAFLREQGVKTS